MPFIKKEDLINGSINFKYHGHIGPEEKISKAGKPYSVYTFDLQVGDDRRQYDISQKSAEFGKITQANRGDTVQAYLNGEWVNWKLIPGVSEPDGMPHNNAKEIKTEREFVNHDKMRTRSILFQSFAKEFIRCNLSVDDVDKFTREMIAKHDQYLSELL